MKKIDLTKSKTPLFDYAKQQGLYHFDENKPDDNDLVFKSKFKGTWGEELDHFVVEKTTSFDLSNKFTRYQIQEWLNLGYQFDRHNGKMNPNEHTPVINKIIDSIPFLPDTKQSLITQQKPCHYLPYHADVLTSTGLDANKVIKQGYRMLVFLTKWMPGQFMTWGNTNISHWKAGDILFWPALKYPHATANLSHHDAFRLRISGLGDQQLLDWVNNDEIIHV